MLHEALLDTCFSELVKMACLYYKNALDTEKQEICLSVFSELSLVDGKAYFKPKEGFDALFKRHSVKGGGLNFLFSELETIYFQVKIAMDDCRYVRLVKQIQTHCSHLGRVCQTAVLTHPDLRG
jgi:hypothetical protein